MNLNTLQYFAFHDSLCLSSKAWHAWTFQQVHSSLVTQTPDLDIRLLEVNPIVIITGIKTQIAFQHASLF